MNIAHLLPYSAAFPLVRHNGRYEWALRLARAQAAQGHTVTMYAAPGSSDQVSDIQWRSVASSGSRSQNNRALMSAAFAEPSHDIFHSHFDDLHYALAHQTTKPIVVTQHWFPSEKTAIAQHAGSAANTHVIPVTHFMKRANKQLGIACEDVIYHGIDLSLFQPSTTAIPAERLLFVGRITKSKGVKEAVSYALATGKPLDIVGKINDVDQAYWDGFAHHIDGKRIRYLGPKTQAEVATLMQQSKALLFPSIRAEAFGQTTIEAQACGTPVIISDVGASTELVQHGMTGYICSSDSDFVQSIQRIGAIDRRNCREYAKQFDLSIMLYAYDTLYEKLIQK